MFVISTVKNIETAIRLAEKCHPDFFRINASHMTPESLGSFCAAYAAHPICSKTPLYVDLQGAKLRVHTLQPETVLELNAVVPLICVDAPGFDASSAPSPAVYVTKVMLRLLAPETVVAIDDGKLAIKIKSVDADAGTASAVVIKGGLLKPRKGFNLRPHPIEHSHLCDRDKEMVSVTKSYPFVRYALSFVCLPSEISELRGLVGPEKVIAAKLERPLEDDQVVALGAEAGELWLCRGDMTVQLGGFGAIAVYYNHFVRDVVPRLIEKKCTPVMAGEVLDHMCDAPEPTRSEVCHLGDIFAFGFKGIVVSNETAVGKYPEEVLNLFKEVSDALEKTK